MLPVDDAVYDRGAVAAKGTAGSIAGHSLRDASFLSQHLKNLNQLQQRKYSTDGWLNMSDIKKGHLPICGILVPREYYILMDIISSLYCTFFVVARVFRGGTTKNECF